MSKLTNYCILICFSEHFSKRHPVVWSICNCPKKKLLIPEKETAIQAIENWKVNTHPLGYIQLSRQQLIDFNLMDYHDTNIDNLIKDKIKPWHELHIEWITNNDKIPSTYKT